MSSAVQPSGGDQARADAASDLDVDHVGLVLRQACPQLAVARRSASF